MQLAQNDSFSQTVYIILFKQNKKLISAKQENKVCLSLEAISPVSTRCRFDVVTTLKQRRINH